MTAGHCTILGQIEMGDGTVEHFPGGEGGRPPSSRQLGRQGLQELAEVVRRGVGHEHGHPLVLDRQRGLSLAGEFPVHDQLIVLDRYPG